MKISFMDKDMDELTQIDVRDVDYIYAVNSDVGDVIIVNVDGIHYRTDGYVEFIDQVNKDLVKFQIRIQVVSLA